MAQPPPEATRHVTEAQWERAVAGSAPTRPDVTVVISGGKRASLVEVLAYVAEDLAGRAAETNGRS